jgi:hypothetical protein
MIVDNNSFLCSGGGGGGGGDDDDDLFNKILQDIVLFCPTEW